MLSIQHATEAAVIQHEVALITHSVGLMTDLRQSSGRVGTLGTDGFTTARTVLLFSASEHTKISRAEHTSFRF